MTTDALRDLCRERGLYESPNLNTKMYLHCRGFRRIQALDQYYNVKALFLDANAIETIENLDRLQELVTLCLDQNLIERIENLTFNLKIQRLNLSYNEISKVENLRHLTCLEDLNLSHNKLVQLDEELLHIPNLHNLDISNNLITEGGDAVSFFSQMQQCRQIKFFGNKGWRNISHWRQKIINNLPSITYLDDKPVFEIERVTAKAWQEGGAVAEKKAREDFNEKIRKAPPTDDWDERRHKVSERMRMALTRIDSQEAIGEDNVPEQPSYDLDEWQHLEKYAQGWRSAIKREGVDAVRQKVYTNSFPQHGSTQNPTTSKKDQKDRDGDEDVNFSKVQFDADEFHSWEQRQLATYLKEQREKQKEQNKSLTEKENGSKSDDNMACTTPPPEIKGKDGADAVQSSPAIACVMTHENKTHARTGGAQVENNANKNENNGGCFNPPVRSPSARTLPPHTFSDLDSMD